MSSKRFKAVVMMLAALALGSILLAACVRPGTTTTSTGGGSTATSTPSGGGGGGGCASGSVHMNSNQFVQSCANISKGSKLTLIDDVQVLHLISNGMWDSSGNVKQVTEPGAPAVNNVSIAGGSADIGPFNTAGTFHIYCSVHQGMNLVVNVK
jgi:plastocyanin